ncbi:DUF928 domain-containing protein [Coleofasciculus sp. FACHB-712]|uniref:DUF928 domain-containing protein n=1 Tax=Coleofasciculus sp. FACHB-712 TaxID=2692789 RepID=UPI0016893DFD|nr:DUF928 domain-containing protein [Coleofasciculus sp. FACHB-712]MBD1944072.1 DUF928 domain-containing protein [Coleofasciculus sp. FACHB-712]
MKLPVQTIKLTFAISWALLACTRLQAQPVDSVLLVQRPTLNPSGQSNGSLIFAAPPPPADIGEPGRRFEAGSRRVCEEMDGQRSMSEKKLLTALVPVYPDYQPLNAELVWGATTAEHPTFWFYVPYQPPFTGEFVLRNKDGKLVYQTNVTLPKTPGVVSLPLPSTAPPLKVGERYRWYFKIYCKPQQPPVFVEGWIQRNSVNPALESQLEKATPRDRVALYATNGFWYEALTVASQLRRTDPKALDWAALLQSVGLDSIAKEPIVECCIPTNN